MRKRKRIPLLIFLSVFFLLNAFNSATAQNRNSSYGLDKYEIAIDLQNIFSYGYPDKALFKINRIKENQIKGAYRFGLGSGSGYDLSIHKSSDDGVTFIENVREEYSSIYLSIGYEFQKKLGHAVFFYGADLSTLLRASNNSEDPYGSTRKHFIIVPFAGAKVPISDYFSLAFEAGIENGLNVLKSSGSYNPDYKRTSDTQVYSKIKFPYRLTFNFNF